MRSRRARQVVAVLLVVAAIAWLPLNHAIEGPTLFVIDATHGVTAADLISVVVFLLARVLFLSGVRVPARRERALTPR
ncbi:hypothetical protein [Actinomycetospora termitidis]|uniref:Uncharacterized protein n=1 Tax=Actinomycetospora termitidis TaxID=3053470 RepID=A0ABT7M2Q1_9PSEU|nr:hypothetical protein [Actinomycetospora sp. Odt1-22]MDL5154944.1 hypothetical protein [Actinomycetospora sp. Odt1-22]